MRRALLLGGTGFVGSHMKHLLSSEYEVVSVGREHDIREKQRVFSLVESCSPDIVINFAFITTVRETLADPEMSFDIGLYGMMNLLSALKENEFHGRVLNISSSEVYGFPDSTLLPISESAPFKPMSPYAVVKIAVEALCHQWSQSEGIDIVTARPFTHIGPGQSDRFALASFSKQISEMALGRRQTVMQVGNLDSKRDLTDVRDVVRAYALLLKIGESGEVYNVCSGEEIQIGELLNQMITHSGLNIKVEQNEALTRVAEQQGIIGDGTKLRVVTGWKPEIPMEQTLIDMFDNWKKRLVAC